MLKLQETPSPCGTEKEKKEKKRENEMESG